MPPDHPGSRARTAGSRAASPLRLDAGQFDAVVFDLDGVLTSTAAQHARAWKRLFDEFLQAHASEQGVQGEPFHPFDIDHDYLHYVDGKPRYDGVESFLASRNIRLPRGEPSDPPGTQTMCALGNRKDGYYHDLIRREGVSVYPGTTALLDALREAGCLSALISASRNTMDVIEAAGIDDRFDTIVDGVRADALGLAGKPAPDVFLRAAADLGVSPDRAAVFEDAASGVRAGRDGEFALVVGVERTEQPGRLQASGAHVEVTGLEHVQVTGRARPRASDALPSAFDGIEAIRARARGRRPAIFLDYDGTLTPIVERPDLAVLSEEMRDAVRRLAQTALVAIVSGRDIVDVRALVDLDVLAYAGSHGFQVRDRDGHEEVLEEAEPYRADLEAAAAEVEAALEQIEGAMLERKGFALAAHYRQVAEERQQEVRDAVERIASGHSRLRVTGGKKVIELRPALPWDKGRAVHALLDRWGGHELFPVYIGDDETDEDAFRALRGRGAGIVVGDVPDTQALYHLPDVPDVGRWLEALHAALAGEAS